MEHHFAIVVSEFNPTITEPLLEGALQRLAELQIAKSHIQVIKVPGAIEIPLTAKLLAKKNQYHVIICLGAVIRGDTDHYNYVCQQVSHGCQRVMLDFEIPIIFGVLTTDTVEQAEDRIGGKDGHKGIEAADAAYQMAIVIKHLASL